MKRMFKRDGLFPENVAILEQELGYPTSLTRCKRLTLTKPSGEVMEIEAVPGKFISCAFLGLLSEGQESFVVDGELHEVAQDFFGPIWDEPGHATVDFLRAPGIMVVIERQGDIGGN